MYIFSSIFFETIISMILISYFIIIFTKCAAYVVNKLFLLIWVQAENSESSQSCPVTPTRAALFSYSYLLHLLISLDIVYT